MNPVGVSDFIRLEVSISGVRGSNISDQLAAVKLLAQGKIKPAVSTVMNLSEIVKAHEMLASNAVNGRIVLDPWPSMNRTRSPVARSCYLADGADQ